MSESKSNKTLADQIVIIAKDEIGKLPVSQYCTIIKTYENGYADIRITNTQDIIEYVKCIGDNTLGINGILTFLNGDFNNPIIITDNSRQNELNTIIALGLGLFTIREDGHLWVELPMGIENYFTIEDDHLMVTLPEGAANDYEIINKQLIYHRGGSI